MFFILVNEPQHSRIPTSKLRYTPFKIRVNCINQEIFALWLWDFFSLFFFFFKFQNLFVSVVHFTSCFSLYLMYNVLENKTTHQAIVFWQRDKIWFQGIIVRSEPEWKEFVKHRHTKLINGKSKHYKPVQPVLEAYVFTSYIWRIVVSFLLIDDCSALLRFKVFFLIKSSAIFFQIRRMYFKYTIWL